MMSRVWLVAIEGAWLWCRTVFFILMFSEFAHSAQEQGDERLIGLTQPISTVLNFESSEYLVVGASQYYGDFELRLKEKYASSPLRIVNASSYKGLDEIMIVSSTECSACIVEVRPTGSIDEGAKSKLWVKPLDSIVSKPEAYSDAVRFFKHYTLAMQFFAMSSSGANVERDQSFEDAIQNLEEVVKVERHEELKQYRWAALSFLADAYGHVGREDEFSSTLDDLILVSNGSNSAVLGYAIYDKGAIEENFTEQLELYDQAIVLAVEIGDKRMLAKIFNRKALNLTRNGQFASAISLLQRAREINRSEGRLRPLIKNLGNLSWVSTRASMLPEALQYASEATLISEKYKHIEGVVLSLYYSGLAYRKLGEDYLAYRFFDRLLEQKDHLDIYEMASLENIVGAVFEELAWLDLEYGEFGSALKKAELMRLSYEKLNNLGRVNSADSLIGQIALKLGRYDLARKKIDGVIEYDRQNRRLASLGSQYLKRAALELDLNNPVEASIYSNKALKILSATEDETVLFQALSFSIEVLQKLGGEEDAWTLSNKLNRLASFSWVDERDKAEYLYRTSLVALELELYDVAISALKEARLNVDNALKKIKRRDLRRKYLAFQKKIYEKSIEVFMSTRSRNVESALLLADSFKARTFEEVLGTHSGNSIVTAEQKERRSRIHSKLLGYAIEKHRSEIKNKASVLDAASALSVSLENLEHEIIESGLKKGPMIQVKKLSLDNIQTENGELIAVYFVGNENSWLWSIHAGQIRGYRLASEAELQRLVKRYLHIYSVPPSQRSKLQLNDQNEVSQILSRALLAHLEPLLLSGSVSKITVVADIALFDISFAALQISEQFLVKLAELSYVPSLYSRRLLKKTSRGYSYDFDALVFVNAGYSEKEKLNQTTLPFSEIEADLIDEVFSDPIQIFRGAEANKGHLFKSLKEHRYRILHFATHGFSSRDIPSLSGLSFPLQSGEASLWLLPEIANSNLASELVFISACNSALGAAVDGEGLLSLSRSFLEAGAKNVVGTLWDVQDNVTAKLVEQFYISHVELETSFSRALQQAQRKIIADSNGRWSDPYYWAGFQLMGVG